MAESNLSSPAAPRHTVLVRATHWATALCFLALLVSGVEILISHPRFYWGESGNASGPALFQLPIPASRAGVKTGYSFVLKDQNGWSRSLHFQAAWLVAFTALIYGISGFASGHFRRNLVPDRAQLAWPALGREVRAHLRFQKPDITAAYNVLQRLTYLLVIFMLFPLMIWTGLAMSPGFTAAVPSAVTAFGGQQSARTIHFFLTLALVLFVLVHVVMVTLGGFRENMRAMITGRAAAGEEEQA